VKALHTATLIKDAQMALVTGSSSRPSGYEIAASDTAWEERYLQLTPSPTVRLLHEFGDSDAEAALSPVAVSEPFRVLSDEGAAVALRIARELERQAVGDARSKRLRGCTYRSQFFAGLYSDPRLIEFLSNLAQADLREHPVGHHQVQLILTDPAPMKGGNTEFFRGTIEEGMRILSERGELPSGRIGKIEYPGPGWAFLQQGHRILHRAASLEEPYPRISLVASYYCADAEWREPTILSPLRKADGRDIALVEWANYAAYRTVQRLQSFLARQPDFSVPLAEVKRQLAECLSDAERAIEEFDSTDPGSLIGLD
jgi:hypothetical protein